MSLTDGDQERYRLWFRQHWEHGVAFNAHCNITVRRWDPEGVELHLPFAEHLSAHPGIFHGGVVSALIDTAGCGAVAAGHDFNLGSRITTVSLAIQYLSVAPGEGALARARCTRRGRQVNYADVTVYSEVSDKPLAQGLVTVSATGVRPGLDGLILGEQTGCENQLDDNTESRRG
jgi:uncharacterized protein (TIGR00369 family)